MCISTAAFGRMQNGSICSGEIHSPELTAIYQRIERCPLTGEPFQIWMRGQGLAATGFLLDLVHKYSTTQPVYLSEAELAAVSESKQFIRSNLSNMPSVLELCKRVAMNKNKLQKAFRLTEGKSIGEYVRTLRMEQALELLEQSDMTVQEIAAAIGYHGVSNFYHAFQQKVWKYAPSSPGYAEKIGAIFSLGYMQIPSTHVKRMPAGKLA